MKIQILDLAKADLIEGYRFYEDLEAGLGRYFLANLYTDIDSLPILGGLHSKPYRHFHAPCPSAFHSLFSTQWKSVWSRCMPSWTAVENPPGFAATSVAHKAANSLSRCSAMNAMESSPATRRATKLLPLRPLPTARDKLLTREQAILVRVILVKALASPGGIGLVGGEELARQLAGLGFVQLVKLCGTVSQFGVGRGCGRVRLPLP
jgi:hypothetical protein